MHTLANPVELPHGVREYLFYDSNGFGNDPVQFRLTYSGPLFASTNRDPQANHKQQLRKHFHRQLKRLWQAFPHLQEPETRFPDEVVIARNWDSLPPKRAEYLANEFQYNGYRYVPLVTKDLVLACAVDILFLRPDTPGGVVKGGDIDNRIKTLFDGLKIATQRHELGEYLTPDDDENPFFCLVEDDSLISSISVETDMVLEPIGGVPQKNDARLVITITLKPTRLTWANMGFV